MVKDIGAGEVPRKAYANDAGLDLYVSEDCIVWPKSMSDVPLGIAIELTGGYVWARITARSSTYRNHKLQVLEGVIDQGYRGPLFVGLINNGWLPRRIKAGDRVAQLIVHETVPTIVVKVGTLSESIRGERGFGSTGS